MQAPLISVIIPNYCHAKFLDQRITSVLNQTYPNIEIIILDDCSPDDGASKTVIEKFRFNKKVSHIIYNETNSGNTFIQWDRGLQLAKGELIWIAESDDYCETNMLEELVKAFYHYPNTVISYTTLMIVDENGKKLSPTRTGKNQYFSSSAYIKRYLSMGNSIQNASCCLFSKAAALKAHPDYKSFKGAGDYLFWVEIAEQGRVAIVNKQLSYFRRHSNIVTEKCNADGTNYIAEKKILDWILERHSINPLRKMLIMAFHCNRIKKQTFNTHEIQTQIYQLWDFNKNLDFIHRKILRLFYIIRSKFNYHI